MLCLALTVIGLDNTILSVAIPTIVPELKASGSQLSWIIDSYTIVFACLLLTSGAIGDRFGRKYLLIAGLVVFGTFSFLGCHSRLGEHLDHRPGRDGNRWGFDISDHAVDFDEFLQRRGTSTGDRNLGRCQRDRNCSGTAPRRVPAGALLVGFGVSHQRSCVRVGSDHEPCGGAELQEPGEAST